MGLHLATNAFSEEIESSLQNETVLIAPLEKKRSSKNSGFFSVKTDVKGPVKFVNRLDHWPDIIFKMCNLIRDCGLYPELITPDFCFGNTYPSKTGFNNHADSMYRWGDSVVGISLNAPCTICFAPKKGTSAQQNVSSSCPNVRHLKNGTVEVELPQRSIYIMSGDSRKKEMETWNKKRNGYRDSTVTYVAFHQSLFQRVFEKRA